MHELRERYGEWAVVTGASSGVGLMFAQKLAAEGLNLVIAARRIGLLDDLREQLTSESLGSVFGVSPLSLTK